MMSNTDRVQLHFSHTEKEYLSAVRFFMLHSTETFARIIAFYVLVSLGFLLLNVLLDFPLPLWLIVPMIVGLGVGWFRLYLVDLPRRYFRGDPKFRADYDLTFTDASIQFKTPDINSSIAWSLYTSVIENDEFYIMIYGKNIPSLSIIPKRAFRDSKDETIFRQMLRRNVDQGLKVKEGEREYVPASLQPPDWR